MPARSRHWTLQRAVQLIGILILLGYLCYCIYRHIISEPDSLAIYAFLFALSGVLITAMSVRASADFILSRSKVIISTGCILVMWAIGWLGILIYHYLNFPDETPSGWFAVDKAFPVSFYPGVAGYMIALMPRMIRRVRKNRSDNIDREQDTGRE